MKIRLQFVHPKRSSMTNTIKSINGRLFVCLNVKDIEVSCAFYATLGFSLTGGNLAEGWAVVNDGENQLHLFEDHISSNTLNFRGGDVFR